MEKQQSTKNRISDKFLLEKLLKAKPSFLLDYSLIKVNDEFKIIYFYQNKIRLKEYLFNNLNLDVIFELIFNLVYSLKKAYSELVFDIRINLNDIYVDHIEKTFHFKISEAKNNIYKQLNNIYCDNLESSNKDAFKIENDFLYIFEKMILVLEEYKFKENFILKDFYKTCKINNIKFSSIKKTLYEKYLEYSSLYNF